MKWKTLKTKIAYENQSLQVREDLVIRPDGTESKYSIVERPPVNFIIAEDQDSRIYFIEEYRYPINKTILQLPAGTMEKNENSLDSAKRELFEETGIKANNWVKLGKFFIGPGHESIYANVYLATSLDLSQLNKPALSGDELILKTIKLSTSEIKELITVGKIECGITIAALNLYFLRNKI
ncbi:MAG: NUDIX hydrolase [Patescibacteria group bacterium]